MKNKSQDWTPPAKCRQTSHGGHATFAIIAAAAVIVMLFAGCSSKDNASTQTSVITASNVTLTASQRTNIHLHTVTSSKFRKTIDTTATVDFDNDKATTVLAPFSGPVSQLLVSLGDKVKADDPLAMANSSDFATAISTYRKALATAKTDRQLADLDKDLLQHHGVGQREANQAETDAVNAESDRDAALQGLVSLSVETNTIKAIQENKPFSKPEGVIRTPIAGTVVEKLITPGQLLQAGSTPCFTVADISHVWVMAHLFGSTLGSVRMGDSVQIVPDAVSTNIPGTVDNISALVDPDSRAVTVRVVAENPEGVLKKSMYVRVLIQAREESTGMLVPVSAILRDDENLAFVYVAQSDGSFARQHVTLGDRTDSQYDITSGLKAGDQVVVEGGIFMQFQQDQ